MEWEKTFLNKRLKLHFGRKIQRQSQEGRVRRKILEGIDNGIQVQPLFKIFKIVLVMLGTWEMMNSASFQMSKFLRKWRSQLP